MKLSLLAAFVLLSFGEVFAQDAGIDYTRVLMPVLFEQPVAGSNGSQWVTELFVTNNADVPVSIYPYDTGCRAGTCIQPPTPPHVTFRPVVLLSSNPDLPAIFLFVDRTKRSDVALVLRALDLSRQSQSAGTELPVVDEEKFRVDRIDLTAVPVAADVRYMLRIYDASGAANSQVRIKLFAVDSSVRVPSADHADRFLGEIVLPLSRQNGSLTLPENLYPAYVQVSDFAAFASLSGISLVRVEIYPVVPNMRIWAFATVTNNSTHQITTVSPQR